MSALNRRSFLAGGLGLVAAGPALAQHMGHDPAHGPLYERLKTPGRIEVPETAAAQR